MLDFDRRIFDGEYLTFSRRTVDGVGLGRLRLSLMHGNGNVILILDEALSELSAHQVNSAFARELCGSFRSVRIDGIAFIRTTAGRVRMTYFERDGTHSQMCGNALRCSALYCRDQGYIAGEGFIHTDDGAKWVSAVGARVRVGLGDGREFQKLSPELYFVFSGLPHLVVVVDDLDRVDVKKRGAALRYDEVLCRHLNHPEGLHVDFMRRQGPDEISVRTYEVGVEDETSACGTGAAGSAFVANRAWLMPFPIRVKTRGGEMAVEKTEHGLVIGGTTEYLFGNTRTGPGSGYPILGQTTAFVGRTADSSS